MTIARRCHANIPLSRRTRGRYVVDADDHAESCGAGFFNGLDRFWNSGGNEKRGSRDRSVVQFIASGEALNQWVCQDW